MTLLCDTAPVTDPAETPPFARLRTLAEEIAAAKQHVTDLEQERDAELFRVTSSRPRSITAAARAAKLSRQRVDGILRLARARRETPPN